MTAGPYPSPPIAIEKDWIDYNGHLNMAYYNVIFDRGGEAAFEAMGLGADYANTRRMTIYTAEVHVCYVRELHLGDTVVVTTQVMDADEKRLHTYEEIRHVDGWLAATAEVLSLHIDMAGPKVAAFPPDIQQRVDAMRAEHAALPRPERAGRAIGIKRR